MTRTRTTALLAAAFVSAVAAANWLTARYGFAPVGFGLEATAGTFAAGACLALRDGLQDAAGRRAVLVAILLGGIVSWATSDPWLAAASGIAFVASEVLDALVYTPLRTHARFGGRRWAVAVVGSNAVGAVADTAVFLALAFGPAAILPALAGQLLGKAYPTLAYLTAGSVGRRAVPRESVYTAGA